ncbi:MAG: helix-turn-helix domain-containing protein [Phormidesmis sp.]
MRCDGLEFLTKRKRFSYHELAEQIALSELLLSAIAAEYTGLSA